MSRENIYKNFLMEWYVADVVSSTWINLNICNGANDAWLKVILISIWNCFEELNWKILFVMLYADIG